MLKEEKYHYRDHRPPYKDFDMTKTIVNKDMDTNIHPDRKSNPRSRKVFINAMSTAEKTGAKWG